MKAFVAILLLCANMAHAAKERLCLAGSCLNAPAKVGSTSYVKINGIQWYKRVQVCSGKIVRVSIVTYTAVGTPGMWFESYESDDIIPINDPRGWDEQHKIGGKPVSGIHYGYTAGARGRIEEVMSGYREKHDTGPDTKYNGRASYDYYDSDLPGFDRQLLYIEYDEWDDKNELNATELCLKSGKKLAPVTDMDEE